MRKNDSNIPNEFEYDSGSSTLKQADKISLESESIFKKGIQTRIFNMPFFKILPLNSTEKHVNMKNTIIQELFLLEELEPFMSLLFEIECGDQFSYDNPKNILWLKNKITSHIAFGTRFFGYRTEAGEILGIVGIQIKDKLFCTAPAEVMDIGVTKKHRNRGLGKILLNHAVTIAKEAGASAIFARTYAADTKTIAFYGYNSFIPIAVIPETNGLNDEGEIVMRRKLSNQG